MEKNKLKIVLIILVVVLIYVGIVFLTSRKVTEEDRKIDEEEVLLFNIDYMFIKSDGVWSFAEDKDYQKALLRKDFQIYSDGKYIGTYKISFQNYYFYYDNKKGNDVQIEYPVMFYSSDKGTLEEYPFETEDLDESDDKLVKSYLDSSVYYPSSKYEFTDKNKVVFDFDNDGTKETLFFVSTGHSDEFSNSEKVFRVVLYKDESGVQELFKDIETRGTPEADFYEYSLFNIFKFSNQDKYTLIIGRSIPMGSPSYCPTIFEFNGNTLEEKATCEEANS